MAQETVTLRVSGDRLMQCAGCENACKAALSRVPGVLTADASHQTQNIQVAYDPEKASIEDMKAVLLKAGYQADAA